MEKSIIQSAGTTMPVVPAKLTVPMHSKCLEAALEWYSFGFSVIPIQAQEKVTVVKWNPWLEGLSEDKIRAHWKGHPDHELGFIVGDNVMVLDADSPQSIGALANIENAFDVTPNLIVKTRKGQHHYFILAQGTFAKTDSHSTEQFPERIDVKARRSMVILPPSTGKETQICEAENVDDLVVVGQDFIDAIFRHNGREVPRPVEHSESVAMSKEASTQTVAYIKAMLATLDPDCGREDWIHVGMAIKHETGGSDEGFAIWNAWSGNGSKYPGVSALRVQWNSFRSDLARPITIASIRNLVTDNGHDWMEVCAATDGGFKRCETVVVGAVEERREVPETNPDNLPVNAASHPLERYSLTGWSAEIEKMTVEQIPILGQIALKGQSTIIYAAPNTGKTLLTLWMIIEGIKAGNIDASKLFYLNMDDTGQGLLDKLHLAEEYGFHMLTEGYRNFKSREFLGILEGLADNNQCQGIVVVLDTLKKFTNLMDKQKASNFTNVAREFVKKGGTLIALAHTNKNPGPDGRLQYTGTTDMVDDLDCAYKLRLVTIDESGNKIVEFENFKLRGNIALRAAYGYTIGNYDSYNELMLTVVAVDPSSLEPMRQVEQLKADAVVIDAVIACIKKGINTKMKLAAAAAAKAEVSKRSALQLIEKYTGDDPATHRWNFGRRGHGAMVFEVLESSNPEPSII